MGEKKYAGSWFQYFPEHYLWSQLMCSEINLALMGGTSFQEVDQIGKALQGKTGDGEAWHDAWLAMAKKVEAFAGAEEKKGHLDTAAAACVRSAIYYYTSERFVHPEDPRKADTYRHLIPLYQKGMKRKIPGFERVEVPYEGDTLAAWWVPPANPTGNDPAVVFFDGLDASKEFTVLWGGFFLRERNIGLLCVDGPGQGETLRLKKIPSRPDYEVAGSAAFDYLAARGGVDNSRIGLMAMSMGGYYAPRIAAFEHRYAACLTWGAHFDYHEIWVHRRKVLESGGSVSSSAIWQLPWVLGTPDMDSAMEKCKGYTLAGVAEKIRMPICITHGQDDNIVPVEMAHRLFAACGSKEKELKIFTVEDGGSQHCCFDNLHMCGNWIADWWMDRFGAQGRQ
ncbi:MAG: prolyl oligopeptidase family serine peptidase [bacterium]|nr:prolyl oligopeptidase family serine peptidase [bacterium]